MFYSRKDGFYQENFIENVLFTEKILDTVLQWNIWFSPDKQKFYVTFNRKKK